MGIKILLEKNYAEAFEKVCTLVGEGLDKKYYVLAPDKYTLRLEKMLFSDKGSFCVEVTSFNRLYYKLSGELTAVLREGGIMIMKKVLSKLKLKYYNKSKNFNGFAIKMYDTVRTLMEAGISSEMLDTEKLSDIARVYEAYQNEIKDKYVDSDGKFKAIEERIDKFLGARVIVVGFNGYSVCEKELIKKISSVAEVIQIDCKDREITPKNPVIVYGASGLADSLKVTAKRLRNAFIEGIKPQDVAVVSPPTAFMQLKRIFTEYDIPFYVDAKKKLSEYPSGAFFCALFEVQRTNFSATSLLNLAKNPYSNIEKEEVDSLELYFDAFGGDRQAFFEPFIIDSEFTLSAQKCKERLIKIIEETSKLLDGDSFEQAVKMVIERFGLKREGTFEPESNLDKILELCEIIDVASIKDNRLNLLCEGIRSCEISRIPSFSGSVTVGEPSTFRGTRPKLLIILGCNEGQIPSYVSEGGILSDDDIDYLNKEGEVLSSRREINDNEEREVLELISLSDEVFAIYDVTAETKRSDFLYSLVIKKQQKEEPFDRLLYECCSQSGAIEKLIKDGILFKEGGEFVEEDGAIYFAVKEKADQLLFDSTPFSLKGSGKKMIEQTTYISQLQTFFNCPAKHFFSYGLRLKKRETSQLTQLDVGNLMHRMVELVATKKEILDIDSEVEKAFEVAVKEGVKYQLKTNDSLIKKLKEDSKKLVKIFRSHQEKGKFVGALSETSFGINAKFRGIEIDSTPPVTLKGKIDYVDFCGDYARVIDFKTGNAIFSLDDLYCGSKIQLPLYLEALNQNGYKGVGMFYFPLKCSWKDGKTSHRLSGIFFGELDTSLIMDETLFDGTESEVISAKTKKTVDGLSLTSKSALTEEEFLGIISYAKKIARYGVEQIMDGNCRPSPLKGRDNPCLSCDFYSSCPSGLHREKKSVKPTFFNNF